MKNKFYLLLMIFMITMTFEVSAQNRIAVLPFTAGEGIDTYAAVRATDTFVSQLIKTSKDTIIGQNEVYRAVADFAFYAIKEFDDRTAAEIGKRLEADMVFVGNVTIGGKKKTDIHVRMVKTDTVDVTFSQTATVRKESENALVSKYLVLNENDSRVKPSKELTDEEHQLDIKEQRLLDKTIQGKWHIDSSDMRSMHKKYNQSLAFGIVKAAVGGVAGVVGAGLFASGLSGLLGNIGNIVGNDMTGVNIGCIVAGALSLYTFLLVTPFCGIDFMRAKRLASIYYKTTGRKLYDDATQYAATKFYRGLVSAGGVAMAVTGGIITAAGIGVFGALMGIGHAQQVKDYGSNYFNDLKAKNIVPWDILQIFGMGVGIPVTFIGILIASLSAIPFVLAPRIRQGSPAADKAVSFLRKTSVGGGYDWQNHQASVAMSIKL